MCVKLIIGAIAGLLGGMPVLAHADDGGDDPFSLDYTAPSERLKPTPESEQAVADALVALSAVTDLPAGERKAIDAELAEVAVRSPKIANGAHYNNHPNRSTVIGHWIVGRGHESDAKTLKFLDPANELWKQYGTKASFSQSASSFHKYVTTNGIVG